MENIYQLSGKYEQAAFEYDRIAAELEEAYIDNGGEVTEDTERKEAALQALSALQDEIVGEIIENSDKYAECALNAEARRKAKEAELKEWKAQVAKAEQRMKAGIERERRREEFWKDNFYIAMQHGEISKIGGARTKLEHSVSIVTTKAVEVNEDVLLAPYMDAIEQARESLPAYCTVEVKVNKSELKKEAQLPEGAAIMENKSIRIN